MFLAVIISAAVLGTLMWVLCAVNSEPMVWGIEEGDDNNNEKIQL